MQSYSWYDDDPFLDQVVSDMSMIRFIVEFAVIVALLVLVAVARS